MAGDWIKMRSDLHEDPTVFKLAALLHQDRFATVGRLHAFWSWADKHAVDGRVDGATSHVVDAVVKCEGFADALQSVKWLEIGGDFVLIPKYERHNGEPAKVRSLKNQRQARWREGRRERDATPSTRASTRASTREEKRRSKSPVVPLFAQPDWLPAAEWAAFEEMRNRIRKPMTDRARKLTFDELAKLRGAGHDPAAVLDQSVRNSWQGVFPLRGVQPAQSGRLAI
jgi:hypothetical protein